MIDDIINALNPVPYYNGVISLFFQSDIDNDIILTKDEKSLIVEQITDVRKCLSDAKKHIHDENFDAAIEKVSDAINYSTCGKCKKKMLLAAYDINHAQSICQLDGDRCTTLKDEINDVIKEFVDNYLPRVEEVLSARES